MEALDKLYKELELNEAPQKGPIRLNPSSREPTQAVDNREELQELRQIVLKLTEQIGYLDQRLDCSNKRIRDLEDQNKKLEERTAAHTTYLETFKKVLENLSLSRI